jgi:hypothetical protein
MSDTTDYPSDDEMDDNWAQENPPTYGPDPDTEPDTPLDPAFPGWQPEDSSE